MNEHKRPNTSNQSAPPISKPGLLQASSVLFSLTMAANLCNYGFHALASRVLGPAEYGTLGSMLALLTILVIPSQTLQLVMAKHISLVDFSHEQEQIQALVWYLILRLLLLGSGLWLILAMLSGPLKTFFHLPTWGPVLAVGLAGVVNLLLPIVRGWLQGQEQFLQLGNNTLADGVLRLGFGAGFFFLGWGATGGLLAGAFSGLLAFWLVAGQLLPRPAIPSARLQPRLASMQRFAVPVVLSLGAYMILTSLDVIMVKHYFAPEQAGYYSAAALVGKAFLFLPYAVAQVLFPKVSSEHAQTNSTQGLLLKSLGLTAGVTLLGIITVWFLAPWVIWTLFGKGFNQPLTLELVKWFGVAVAPLALVYVLTQYHLAIHSWDFAVLLLLDIPVLLLLLALFHASLPAVLLAIGANHAVLFLIGYGLTRRSLA